MIADHADDVFPRYGITTIRRQACVIAHAAVETGNSHGAFQRLEEDLDYTAERLPKVWPKRFPTVASAAPFAHNPHALAIKVYGDRMGNRPGTDDGWTFCGKGIWNETGRKNVTALGGEPHKLTRKDAARSAGLSDDQQKTRFARRQCSEGRLRSGRRKRSSARRDRWAGRPALRPDAAGRLIATRPAVKSLFS